MITIQVTNIKCKLIGERKKLLKIQKAFKVRNPNAFFIRRAGMAQQNWDGKINYITDSFYFKIGLLPMVVEYIKNTLNEKVEFNDLRSEIKIKPVIPEKLGSLTLRDIQKDALKAIVNNKVGDLAFPIGVVDAATNFGKTLIMAGIYLAFKKKLKAIVIINDGDLFEQFKNELPALVGEEVGFVRGKKQTWHNFTVIMAQTVSRNINVYKKKLHQYSMVLVDEADLADNKTYKTILNQCYNAFVRVGLSGTIFMSKLAKDKPKNMNLHSYFGLPVYKITKKEMVEKGHSTNIIIRINEGSSKNNTSNDWKKHYNNIIVYNEERAKLVLNRVKANLKIGRKPILVVAQYHDHVKLLYRILSSNLKKYKVYYVHGGINKEIRKKILKEFREGEIDILISSFIIKRGKNIPLTRVLINAAAGDSAATVSQLMGRLERTHSSKKRAYMEDFYDTGSKYLARHSKHRLIYYKKEGFKVKTKF